MLLNPIQNTAKFNLEWIQVRPRITQDFGENPQIYEQFGMIGHNGTDFGVPVGTEIFSPTDGVVKVLKSDGGYGLHMKIRSSHKAIECVLAHLSEVSVLDGSKVYAGQFLGYSGNTGFSTGPHLHYGVRRLESSSKSVWNWEVENHDNGYFGYIDPAPLTISWKGTLDNYTL